MRTAIGYLSNTISALYVLYALAQLLVSSFAIRPLSRPWLEILALTVAGGVVAVLSYLDRNRLAACGVAAYLAISIIYWIQLCGKDVFTTDDFEWLLLPVIMFACGVWLRAFASRTPLSSV